MPDMTISLNNDGSYRLTPPFLIVPPADQEIWNLIGTPPWNWLNLGAAEGIACDTNPPSPYSPWPSSQPTLNTANQYIANVGFVNRGSAFIDYKFTFSVINTQTGAVVQVDPDIGNQPEGGMDGDHGKGNGRK